MYQSVPECTKSYQIAPDSCLERPRLYQSVPDTRLYQSVPRVHQIVPDCARLYQSVPECTRVYQIVPDCTRLVSGASQILRVPGVSVASAASEGASAGAYRSLQSLRSMKSLYTSFSFFFVDGGLLCGSMYQPPSTLQQIKGEVQRDKRERNRRFRREV